MGSLVARLQIAESKAETFKAAIADAQIKIDALKAKWGFEIEQTAKLKRHGLWCVLFLTRCQGDESKEDYAMRVQRLMHDICDSYVDKAIKVDAVIADMAEAALIRQARDEAAATTGAWLRPLVAGGVGAALSAALIIGVMAF